MPGLPRRRTRDSACRRRQIAGKSRQHSHHLRPVPRAEVPDGVERRERPGLHRPIRKACTGWPSRKARRRPPSAPIATASHEILAANDAEVADLQVQCSRHLRQMPRRSRADLHAEHSRAGNRARQRLAPVCTDCHGIHSIKAHGDPNSPSRSAISPVTSAPAATRECVFRRSSAFPANRVSSYMDSYHGLAAEGGSVVAANCSSCHGVHNILPSSDPRSTINHANLDATCGKCHKGVTQKFILTRVHLEDGVHSNDIGSVVVRWVRLIYIVLILLVIGAHVPAQRDHLAQQGHRAAQNAEPHDDAHDHQSALAASDSAHQLHRSGDHRLRA